jgi:hypothetical protein
MWGTVLKGAGIADDTLNGTGTIVAGAVLGEGKRVCGQGLGFLRCGII